MTVSIESVGELPPTLTAQQAAQYLNQGLTKTKAAIKDGSLKSYKNGRLRRIRREWLLEYERQLIAESEVGAAP